MTSLQDEHSFIMPRQSKSNRGAELTDKSACIALDRHLYLSQLLYL